MIAGDATTAATNITSNENIIFEDVNFKSTNPAYIGVGGGYSHRINKSYAKSLRGILRLSIIVRLKLKKIL